MLVYKHSGHRELIGVYDVYKSTFLGIIAILLAILGPLQKPKFEIFFWVSDILTIFTGFGSHFPVFMTFL